MSGKVSAKGAVITVDDGAGTPRIITTDVVSFELEQDAGKVDVTGFGEGGQNFVPGLPVYGITLNLLWNTLASTGAWTVLKSIFGSATSVTVSVKPEATGQTMSGEFMLDALPASGTPDGPIQIGSVHFSQMGPNAATWA
jgi:hypothetical protein